MIRYKHHSHWFGQNSPSALQSSPSVNCTYQRQRRNSFVWRCSFAKMQSHLDKCILNALLNNILRNMIILITILVSGWLMIFEAKVVIYFSDLLLLPELLLSLCSLGVLLFLLLLQLLRLRSTALFPRRCIANDAIEVNSVLADDAQPTLVRIAFAWFGITLEGSCKAFGQFCSSYGFRCFFDSCIEFLKAFATSKKTEKPAKSTELQEGRH